MKTAISALALLSLGVLSPPQASAFVAGHASCGLSSAIANQEEEETPPKTIEAPQEAEPDC